MKKFLKSCAKNLCRLLFLAVFIVVAAVIWFQVSPPALTFLNPRIQAHLDRFEPEYRIRFDTVRLSWPGWQFNPRVRIDGIEVRRYDAPAFEIPRLLVTLDLGRLLSKEIAPVRIQVESLRLRPSAFQAAIAETPSKPTPGQEKPSRATPGIIARRICEALFAMPRIRDREPHLEKIIIKDALLDQTGNADAGDIRIPELSLTLHSVPSGDMTLGLTGVTSLGGKPSRIQLTSRFSMEEGSAETEIHLTGIMPSRWAGYFPRTDWLKGYDAALNGDFQGTLHQTGRIERGRFGVTNSGGRISHDGLFEKPVVLRKFLVKGGFSEDLSQWTLEEGILNLEGPTLSASGKVVPFGEFPSIELDVQVENVSLEGVARYWPLPLEPKVREWIGTHFTAGRVDRAEAKFRFHPEDFKAEPLPKQTIDITVPFTDVALHYHDPMAEVRRIAGLARFSAHGVGIDVRSGESYHSDIEKGRVDIVWIPGRPEINIQATASGPADDLRQAVGDLLGVPDTPPRMSKGSARTELRFRFPLDDFTSEEFIYEARSEVTGILAPDVFGFQWTQKALSLALQPDLLKVSGTGGEVNRPEALAAPVRIPKLQMKGLIRQDPPGVEISSFSADLDGPVIHASGHVLQHADYPDIDINFQVDRMTLPEAIARWPLPLAGEARSWIESHFQSGRIKDAHVRLNLEPEHFSMKRLPANSIEAEIPFEGVAVDYFPPLPGLKKVRGTATFESGGVRIEVDQGEVSHSRLTGARVDILGWDGKTPRLTIQSNLAGPANDLIDAVAALREDAGDALPRFDSASAKTRLRIECPLTDNLSRADLMLSGESDIDAIRIADLYGFRIDDGYLRAELEAGKVSFTGGARADTIPFDVQGHLIVPDSTDDDSRAETPGEAEIQLKAVLHAEDLPRLGLPRLPFLEGSAETTTRVRIEPSATDITLTADLLRTRIELAPLGWTKPASKKGTLEIHGRPGEEGEFRFSMIHFFSEGARFSGFGDIRTKTPARASFHFDRFDLGRNRLKLVFDYDDGTSDVRIRGNTLDLAPLITGSPSEGEKESETPGAQAAAPPSQKKGEKAGFTGSVHADLKRMLLSNDQSLQNPTARTEWRKGRLFTANLKAEFDEGETLRIAFSPNRDGRRLSIHSENGGRLLDGLNITSHLLGGTLDVSAQFGGPLPPAPDDRPARADVSLSRFTLMNAPHLMQILSMASFVGLVGQLQSGGIEFDLLQALLTYQDSVLTVEEAGMEGISLGLTAEGALDFQKKTLDLDGMVIPFNVLNKVIDAIPLVGKYIVGDGIIATEYSLTGNYRDPKVSIHPLSTLQMGFLRDIFGKFKLHKLDESSERSTPPRNQRK